MKMIAIVLFVLLIFVVNSYSEKAKIPNSKAGLKKNDIFITNWNPPTSLFTHFGYGSNKDNDPVFNFNLNVGFMRFFMKSDADKDDTYIYNSKFSYVIEIKPLDFGSFLSSGSSYSLFIEENEWLRNFTFILGNKTFSSTQLITSEFLWYFDFLYNAVNVSSAIEPQNRTAKSALENFYPTTREESIGLMNKFHILQNSSFALGILAYFEFNLPQGKEQVAKGPFAGALTNLYSDRFTFSTLGGLYFKYKKDETVINSKVLYHRMQGDFDDWVITVKQNTLSLKFEISFSEQFFVHTNYYLIHWTNEEYKETFYSHTANIGGEIRGFGDLLNWLGAGLDFFYQGMKQKITSESNGSVDGVGFVFSAYWYPLSFHEKNHNLKIGLTYGLFNYKWDKDYFIAGNFSEEGSGWADSIMVRIDYSF